MLVPIENQNRSNLIFSAVLEKRATIIRQLPHPLMSHHTPILHVHRLSSTNTSGYIPGLAACSNSQTYLSVQLKQLYKTVSSLTFQDKLGCHQTRGASSRKTRVVSSLTFHKHSTSLTILQVLSSNLRLHRRICCWSF